MRPASLSLDLDNRWSYLKVHGDQTWREYPSFLETLIPRVLDALDYRNIRLTFFIVGRDAACSENREMLGEIARRGHEAANHSFHHEPWVTSSDDTVALREEIVRAHEAIADATGLQPRGFRAPGFASSPALRSVLAAEGYTYDASDLATFIGPLARKYYFRTANLSEEEKQQRADLFGDWRDARKKNRGHAVATTEGSIAEIPVTTMPLLRLPFHLSYLHYVDAISPRAADAYFASALALCRATGTQPSLLLHPLDFLGREDAPDLQFFPSMNVPAAQKMESTLRFIDTYVRHYSVETMRDHAARIVLPGAA